MNYINYTMPLFKKALKRNFPKIIHLTKKVVKGYNVYEFWFVTQKAVICYAEPVRRSVDILMDELLNYGYVIKKLSNNDSLCEHRDWEFVKYE